MAVGREELVIIDLHTHSFPERIAASAIAKLSGTAHVMPFSDGTTEGLLSSMVRNGVDLSVMLPVAVKPSNVPGMNDYACTVNETYGGRGILSFAAMHPDYPQWREELDRIVRMGFRGIKIHPVYQGVDQDDPRYLRILERAGELDLAVVAHAGMDFGFPGVVKTDPRRIRKAVEQVGPVKLIAAHMGSWKNWEEVELLFDLPSVSVDTSFCLGSVTPLPNDPHYTKEELQLLSNERFCKLVRAFGPERVYFGSDSPWNDQGDAIRKLKACGLTSQELDRILSTNARQLLGI